MITNNTIRIKLTISNNNLTIGIFMNDIQSSKECSMKNLNKDMLK